MLVPKKGMIALPYRILAETEDVLSIGLFGEIDHHTAAPMREGIDAEALRRLPRLLILDFAGVTFMDSSGIGLVMGRCRLLETFGGRVELENVPAPLKKVMRLAGLERLVRISQRRETHETV